MFGLRARAGDRVPGQQIARAGVLAISPGPTRGSSAQDEDLPGTREVGRLGDVVVISNNYFGVADEDLKKLHSGK